MTALPANDSRIAPAGDPAAAGARGPGLVLEVQARMNWMAARQLPRLAQLRESLAELAAGWTGMALERALAAHLTAVAALRFELLVSPGLRAALPGRDEEAFRAQVAQVSACTEATWAQLRVFLGDDAPQLIATEAFSDFILEVRSIQRGVVELSPEVIALAGELEVRRQGAASDLGRAALAELLEKAAGTLRRLEQLRSLCEAGHKAQKVGFRLADERAAARASLKKLAHSLGHGLLERLRALISLEQFAPGEELRAAQHAAGELQAGLAEAIEQVRGLQDGQRDLLLALQAMAGELRAAQDAPAG